MGASCHPCLRINEDTIQWELSCVGLFLWNSLPVTAQAVPLPFLPISPERMLESMWSTYCVIQESLLKRGVLQRHSSVHSYPIDITLELWKLKSDKQLIEQQRSCTDTPFVACCSTDRSCSTGSPSMASVFPMATERNSTFTVGTF